MTVHDVFLSHSGRQKDFVEQLSIDLERGGYSCFFDKDPQSLPKGEEFPSRIFEAARRCRVAVVLLTEDYFSNSKWPMLELAAFVDAQSSTSNPDLKILPLFFDISLKEYPHRQNEWFKKWSEWEEGDSRVDVENRKRALKIIRAVNGLAFKRDMGQVHYRGEIAKAVGELLRKMSERCEYVLIGTSFALYEDDSKEMQFRGELDAAYKTGILRKKSTPASLRTFIHPLPLLEKTIMEGTCWACSANVMAHGCLTGFFVNAQHMPELKAKSLYFAQGGCIGETDPNSTLPRVKKFAWGEDFAYDGEDLDDSIIAACFFSKSNHPVENVAGAADRYKRCVYVNIRYGNEIGKAAVVSHLWKEEDLVLGYEETANDSLERKKTFGDQILQSCDNSDNYVSYYISYT